MTYPPRGNGGLKGAPVMPGRIELDDAEKAWKLDAACRNSPDPDLFFPSRGESTRTAKAICAGCVVRAECLDYAMRHGERFGIWGGASERERRRMRRQKRQRSLA